MKCNLCQLNTHNIELQEGSMFMRTPHHCPIEQVWVQGIALCLDFSNHNHAELILDDGTATMSIKVPSEVKIAVEIGSYIMVQALVLVGTEENDEQMKIVLEAFFVDKLVDPNMEILWFLETARIALLPSHTNILGKS